MTEPSSGRRLNRPTPRADFSLLEVMVAAALMAGLMGLTLTAIMSSGRPVVHTTTRADLVNQGTAAMNTIVRELQGAPAGQFQIYPSDAYLPATNDQSPTLPPTGIPPTVPPLEPDSLTATGRMVRYQRIERYEFPDLFLEVNASNDTNHYYFAFREDAALGGFMLVQRVPGLDTTDPYREVVILRGIHPTAGTGDDDPPRFARTASSSLRVEFVLRRQIDFDRSAREPVFVDVAFDQTIPLRNQ